MSHVEAWNDLSSNSVLHRNTENTTAAVVRTLAQFNVGAKSVYTPKSKGAELRQSERKQQLFLWPPLNPLLNCRSAQPTNFDTVCFTQSQICSRSFIEIWRWAVNLVWYMFKS